MPSTPVLLHGGLSSPVGMAHDASGHVYVASWSAGTILRFSSDGRHSIFAEGLRGPSGLAISSAGDIKARTINADLKNPGSGIVLAGADGAYVVDYAGTTVSRVTRSGQRMVIADGLGSPVGLARAPHGSLVVATWGANSAFPLAQP